MRDRIEACVLIRQAWLELEKASDHLYISKNFLALAESSIDYFLSSDESMEIEHYIHGVQGSIDVLINQIQVLADETELTEGDLRLILEGENEALWGLLRKYREIGKKLIDKVDDGRAASTETYKELKECEEDYKKVWGE